MWGNTLGWCIALVIVVAMVGGLCLLDRHLTNVTPITDFVRDHANLAPIELPISAQSVLPPTKSADATDWYRQAIDLYLLEPGANLSDALELLIPAREHAQASIFADSPEDVVKYGDKPKLAAILALGKAANRRGALLSYEKNPDEAIKHHQAAFALGARLYEERLTLDELLAGLELMSEASAGIIATGSDTIDTQTFTDYRTAFTAWSESRIRPMQRIVTSIDPAVIARHSGDVFYIARHAPERMWRVEAILSLGRLRFNAARVADQQGANRAIQELRDDPDPVIRAAAQAAMELTIERYRMLG